MSSVVGVVLLSATLVEARTRPIETSLVKLSEEYGWQNCDPLTICENLEKVASRFNLVFEPQIGEGDLQSIRVVKCQVSTLAESETLRDLTRGECADLEFKETLLLDVKKNTLGGRPLSECASTDVTHSVLKTIAAFMNTQGGTLLVGVTDDASVACLSREYPLIKGADQSFDKWELYLRGKVDQYFCDGRAAAAAITIQRVLIEQKELARIVVGARSQISFLKWDGAVQLFIRNGNRSISVPYDEIEKFYECRRLFV